MPPCCAAYSSYVICSLEIRYRQGLISSEETAASPWLRHAICEIEIIPEQGDSTACSATIWRHHYHFLALTEPDKMSSVAMPFFYKDDFVTSTPDTDTVSQPVILGFDPGRQKCGLAVMGLDRTLYHRSVVTSSTALDIIETLRQEYPVSLIVMGDQTTAKTWKAQLATLKNLPRIVMIDERYSSLEARDRYWQLHPPRGLQRLLPQGLRHPNTPIDDIVAMLLIERYLNRLTQG